jgi:O-succinylbenzoic acid--CoA ligase
MSETSGGCVYDGVPLDGVSVRLGDEGRVTLAGPVLMSGYRLAPELTAEALVDGWLVTNDVGAYDEAGRLVVRGRVDDVVITGGENVVTIEVAARLMGHPAVSDVAVTGVPDDEWGQRLVAIVVPASSPPPSLDQLRAWCRETLPAAAAPRQIVVVDDLPRLPSGKADRLAISRLAANAAR